MGTAPQYGAIWCHNSLRYNPPGIDGLSTLWAKFLAARSAQYAEASTHAETRKPQAHQCVPLTAAAGDDGMQSRVAGNFDKLPKDAPARDVEQPLGFHQAPCGTGLPKKVWDVTGLTTYKMKHEVVA